MVYIDERELTWVLCISEGNDEASEVVSKKVRGGDGGRWWNEPKSEICDEGKLASMSESDDVTKSWPSFKQRYCVFAAPYTKYS